MARILVIESDAGARAAIARDLEPCGHRLTAAATAAEGLRLTRALRPALVLVARRLCASDGLGVCRTLQGDAATARIPIVLIAEGADEIDRAVARELGIVGYLVRPLPRGELAAHVGATLRRARIDESDGWQRLGCLAVSVAARAATVEGRAVRLTPVEIALLRVLCEGEERVITRVELLARVWGEEGRDETRLVDQYVKRLRRKLGAAGAYIETVRGAGYRFARGRAEGESVVTDGLAIGGRMPSVEELNAQRTPQP